MMKNKTKSSHSFWQIVSYIIPFVFQIKEWKLRAQAFFSFFFVVASICINVCIPIFFKKLIITLELPKNPEAWHLGIIMIATYGILWTTGQAVWQLREVFSVAVFSRVLRQVCLDIFSHLMKLSIRFHSGRHTGAITSAIAQAQEAVPEVILGVLYWVLPIFLEIYCSSMVIAYFYGFTYGFIIFALFFIYFCVTYMGSKIVLNAQAKLNDTQIKSGAQLVDSMLNVDTAKYFGNIEHEIEKADTRLAERENAEKTFFIRLEILHMVQGIVIGLCLTSITVISGISVLKGNFLISDFVMMNSYMMQFVIPMMILSKIVRNIRKGVALMQNAMNLLMVKPEIKEIPNPTTITTKGCVGIKFDDVHFEYYQDISILKGLSFYAKPGTTTAIVGATGAGKSTITRLLFRLYDATAGQIKIDDTDISTLSLENLNSLISVVPQNAVLFNSSLGYNISYGNLSASSEEIQEAVRMAQLEKFIASLPNGMETSVGEHGIRLSGGERQRVAIARAILKKPKIFIFDEATSALDTHTEREIQKNLRTISKNITTIIVAHRLSTITYADQIILIEGGTTAETGSHKELLEQKGHYSRLWNQQFSI